jgi:hypothetical protein
MRAFSRPIRTSESSREPGISSASACTSPIMSSSGYQAATFSRFSR